MSEVNKCSICREIYWKTWPHCYCDIRDEVKTDEKPSVETSK